MGELCTPVHVKALTTSAGLDLGAALEDTGVAIVTDENPAANLVSRRPRVYTVTPVSVAYANVGNLLAAYATDFSTGEPAEDVVIMLNATTREVCHARHPMPFGRCANGLVLLISAVLMGSAKARKIELPLSDF